MTRNCNQCNCELTTQNAAKKDALRFRSTCRRCYAVKRRLARKNKAQIQSNHLNYLINKKILKLETPERCYKCDSSDYDCGLIIRSVNYIKNFINRISNALHK